MGIRVETQVPELSTVSRPCTLPRPQEMAASRDKRGNLVYSQDEARVRYVLSPADLCWRAGALSLALRPLLPRAITELVQMLVSNVLAGRNVRT